MRARSWSACWAYLVSALRAHSLVAIQDPGDDKAKGDSFMKFVVVSTAETMGRLPHLAVFFFANAANFIPFCGPVFLHHPNVPSLTDRDIFGGERRKDQPMCQAVPEDPRIAAARR